MDAFENLEVWRRGSRLSVGIYRILAGNRDYGFKDQLFRSSLSVPSNIAEGHERGSSKEFIRFLHIAKGSCGELRTQLLIGIEAGILQKDVALEFVTEAREISMMIQGLINRLQKSS